MFSICQNHNIFEPTIGYDQLQNSLDSTPLNTGCKVHLFEVIITKAIHNNLTQMLCFLNTAIASSSMARDLSSVATCCGSILSKTSLVTLVVVAEEVEVVAMQNRNIKGGKKYIKYMGT